MNKFVTFSALTLLIPAALLADEIEPPRFKSAPLEFVNIHQTAFRWNNDRLETVSDILLIGDEENKMAMIYIKTIGNNYHMCNVAGEAKKEGKLYVFRHQDCHLTIQHDSNEAKVSDVDGKCKRYFCGMMGNLMRSSRKKINLT